MARSIIHQYLAMVPIASFDWKTEQWESEDLASVVLKSTVEGFISRRYPPSQTYIKSFLKTFIQKLEEIGFDIPEDVYHCYFHLLKKENEEQDIYSFRTYLLNESQIIILEESKAMVAMGTTGLRTWEAAIYLAEWSIKNLDKFINRDIVELGCGLGLTGITVLSSCCPRTYIFTDCHSEVLQRLCQNILLNISRELNLDITECKNDQLLLKTKLTISEISADEKKCHVKLYDNLQIDASYKNHLETCENDLSLDENEQKRFFKIGTDLNKIKEISVIDVNWGDLHEGNWNRLDADVILAADVLYDPAIIPDFIHVIQVIFENQRKNSKKCEAYIASTLRNESTFNLFVDLLEKNGIMYQEVRVSPQPSSFYYQNQDKIKMLMLWNM